MSEGRRFLAEEAWPVAAILKAALAPYCSRIEIKGSLCRLKHDVGDIEILFVPRTEDRQKDFFSTEPVDLAAEKIGKMILSGEIGKRPNKAGFFTWGPLNKLGIHIASGIPVDLFSTSESNWWVSSVIRTGSKDMNLALTNGAIKLGRTLNAYGCGVTMSDGTIIPATSEQHVFELCGVAYREPKDR